ncbi:hypothetical protein ABE504_12725 [Paenibacillus oryzisoli]|uniref:hypothetical protein n=1 Tax=Paenibacillus oryzisoli TaxID=1850517 RepID=UPI003D2B9B1D
MAANEIKRVQALLNHAQQLAGSSKGVDERVKSLSSRLEALKQLQGGQATETETAAASEEASVAEEAKEETAAEEEAAESEEAEASEEESA